MGISSSRTSRVILISFGPNKRISSLALCVLSSAHILNFNVVLAKSDVLLSKSFPSFESIIYTSNHISRMKIFPQDVQVDISIGKIIYW